MTRLRQLAGCLEDIEAAARRAYPRNLRAQRHFTNGYRAEVAGPEAIADLVDSWAEAEGRAAAICARQPGYGTPAYRGDPYEAVGLDQYAARLRSTLI